MTYYLVKSSVDKHYSIITLHFGWTKWENSEEKALANLENLTKSYWTESLTEKEFAQKREKAKQEVILKFTKESHPEYFI